MAKLRLHLDADTSNRRLQQALLQRGHDVTRTPAAWMPLDATDLEQLLGASAQGRCIFTYNARDYISLGQQYSEHSGIILAAQQAWRLPDLIRALDRLLSESENSDWIGQIRWLNQWR
jgi:hypothetical protein